MDFYRSFESSKRRERQAAYVSALEAFCASGMMSVGIAFLNLWLVRLAGFQTNTKVVCYWQACLFLPMFTYMWVMFSLIDSARSRRLRF